MTIADNKELDKEFENIEKEELKFWIPILEDKSFSYFLNGLVKDDIKEIAQETSELAQKGISDDLSGLVGNASSLVDALNQLVRTAAGIGSFLILMGFVSITISCLLVIQAFK